MSWNQIVGHRSAYERFERSLARHRLANTYLFVGPDGVGKRTFALKLAEALLCENSDREDPLEPCGNCPGCLQVRNQSHPDLILIRKPVDKSILPVELFIGRKEHRRKEGLVYEIGMKPFRGGYRIAIIEDADFFNQESANSLLKTLEEPPPKSLLILLGTSEARQLQTIVSRSQLVRFSKLTVTELETVLSRPEVQEEQQISEDTSISKLALMAQGSVSRAVQLADPEVLEFRELLYSRLATGDPHAQQFTKAVTAFAESGGKEGYRKRPRMKLVADFAIEFFREVNRLLAGLDSDCPDETLMVFARQFAEPFMADPLGGAQRVGRCIERTSDMQLHVAGNVGFPNLLDSWLIDLGRLGRGEQVTTGQSLAGIV